MGVFQFLQNEIGSAGNAIQNNVVNPVSNAFHSVASSIVPAAENFGSQVYQGAVARPAASAFNYVKNQFNPMGNGFAGNALDFANQHVAQPAQDLIGAAGRGLMSSSLLSPGVTSGGNTLQSDRPANFTGLNQRDHTNQVINNFVTQGKTNLATQAGGFVGNSLPYFLGSGPAVIGARIGTEVGNKLGNYSSGNGIQNNIGNIAKDTGESLLNNLPGVSVKGLNGLGTIAKPLAKAGVAGLENVARLQGNNLIETGKPNTNLAENALQFGVGAGIHTILHPAEAAKGAYDAVGAGGQALQNGRDFSNLAAATHTNKAELPTTETSTLPNGQQVIKPADLHTVSVPEAQAEQMIRNHDQVPTQTIVPTAPGPHVSITMDSNRKIVSWEGDRPQFDQHIMDSAKQGQHFQSRQPGFLDLGATGQSPKDAALAHNNPAAPLQTELPPNTGTGSGQVTDSFSQHAKTSPDLTPASQDALSVTSHEARNTQQLGAEADQLAQTDPAAAMQLAQQGKTDKSVATAISLIKQFSSQAAQLKSQGDAAGAQAKNDQMAELVATHTKNALEAGRTVQANSLLASMSPEGRVSLAQKGINSYNEKNPNKQIPNITGEQSSGITDEQNAVDVMPEGVAKEKAQQKVNEGIAALIPSSLSDKSFALYRTGLLTGFRTPGKVVGTNATTLTTEGLKNIPAAGVDALTSMITGQRGMKATAQGYLGGAWKGTLAGVDNFFHGYNAPGTGGESSKEFGNKTNFGDSTAGKIAQVYVDAIGRLHSSLYKPFWGAQHLNSLTDMALTNASNQGLSGTARDSYVQNFIKDAVQASTTTKADKYAQFTTPEGAASRAAAEANYTTNLNKTWLGNLASGATSKGGNGARAVVPFTQIPAALATKIIDYSPVGPFKEAIAQATQLHGFDQRAFSQAVGRGIVGTGVMAVGFSLAKEGLMSGAYPTDKKTQALWQATGKIPDAVLGTDGKWHQLAALGSAGNALAVGAATYDGLQGTAKKPGDLINAGIGGAAAGAAQIANSPYLQSINNITSALKTPGTYGLKTAEGFAGSLIPTGVANIATALDPQARQTNGIADAFTNKIPRLRNQNLPQVDTFGQAVPRPSGFLDTLINPTYPSTDRSNAFTNNLAALASTGNDATPTKTGKSISVGGASYALNPAQQTALQTTSGQAIQQGMQQLMNTPQYQQLDNAGKQAALSSLETAVRSRGDIQFNNQTSLPLAQPGALSPNAKATIGLVQALRSGDTQQAQSIISSIPFASRSTVYNDAAKQVNTAAPNDQQQQIDIQKALGMTTAGGGGGSLKAGGGKISGNGSIGSGTHVSSGGGGRKGSSLTKIHAAPRPISIKPITIHNAGGSTKLGKPPTTGTGSGKISLSTFGARKLSPARRSLSRRLRA